MTGQTIQRFVAASILGAAATVLDVNSAKDAARSELTEPVVIAVRDIQSGATIDESALVVAQWPKQIIPSGSYGSIDSVVARVTSSTIFRGEVVTRRQLASAGVQSPLEVRITPGKRAMGIRVDDPGGMFGMMQPNSRVDVVVASVDGASSKAYMLLENMRLLAFGAVVGRSADGSAEPMKIATLEVTPNEAEVLATAARNGRLQVLVRGYGDPGRFPGRDIRSAARRSVATAPGR